MKRTAVNHNKTNYLKTLLKRPRFHVLGILESLWQLTSRDFKRGNIGKISNERIACELEWDGDPNDLINSLEMAGFIDPSPEHRLVVHDWSHHCEDSIHTDLARKGEYFADGTKPKLSRLSAKERDAAESRYDEGRVVPEMIGLPFEDEFERTKALDSAQKRPAPAVAVAVAPPLPLPKPTDNPPAVSSPAKTDGGGFKIPEKLQTTAFLEAWDEFRRYNAALRAPFVKQSLEKLLEQFAEWGPESSAVAIHTTILSGGKLIKKPEKARNNVPQGPSPCADCGSTRWSSKHHGGCNLCRDDYGKKKPP